MEKKHFPLNAVHLRYLALGLMLLDHLWGTVVSGNDWMTCLGRMALPIFAFQAAEGYANTSNFKQYCKRLLLFGLLSEIPFNLMIMSSWIYPFHQNAMFTMLLGILALRSVDKARQGTWAWLLGTLGCCLLGAITLVDFGAYGVAMVLLFGLFRNRPGEKLLQFLGMVLINVILMEGRMMIVFGREIPQQSFAVLALILIWLYNGEKGNRSKALQLGFYLFYPVHMIVLYGIRYFA